MKIITTLMLLINFGLTIYFIEEVKPSSLGSYIFWSVYLSLPYALMGYFIFKENLQASRFIVTIIVCLLTLFVYFDILYLNPDPQAMLFIFMLPVLQVGVIFIWLVIRMIRR